MKIFHKLTAAVAAFTVSVSAGALLPLSAYADEYEGWDELDLANEQRVLAFVDDGQTIYSDEEFYGQFDTVAGEWVKPGLLDYVEYPGLAAVQEAAKKSDYETAKYELLEFYRDLYDTFQPVYNNVSPNANLIYQAYAIKNNFQLNSAMVPTVLGIPVMGNEDGYVEINITDRMSSILAQPSPVYSVELFGLKKDGTCISIESLDAGSGHPPVVEVRSKGVVQKFVATDDSYISPQANYDKNYGHEPEILAEESISSIGLERLADSNTKRGLIKFDFTELDAATAVDSAYLKLYGRNASGLGSGELLVIEYSNNTWNEDEVTYYEGQEGSTLEHGTFSNYGMDSYRFDGGVAPVRDGIYNVFAYRYPEELLRFAWATVFSQLYHYDQDERQALAFFNQWIGYLNQRGKEPRYDKTLDGHCRDKNICEAMYEMINSKYMSAEIFSATLKYMYMECRAQIDGPYEPGNWGVYQLTGMTTMAAYLPTLTLNEELIECIQQKAADKIAEAYYDDGSAYEIAWSYSFTGTFMGVVEAEGILRRCNNFEDSIFPGDIQEKCYEILKYFASLLMPGGGNPQVGDEAGYTGRSYHNENRNQLIYKVVDVPFWRWLATDGAEGEAPDWTTVRYTATTDPNEFKSGVYTMRDNWTPEGVYLYTDVDGNIPPGHGHQDDNHIIVKAYGQYLLTDQSFSSYATNSVKLAQTLYHNTVTIDNTTQSFGKTAYEGLNPVKKEKRYETNSLYVNTTLTTPQNGDHHGLHTRNILFNKIGAPFWIVNDYLEPLSMTREHNYQQNWHMLPAANPTMDEDMVGKSNFSETANIWIAQANTDDMTEAVVHDGYFGQGNSRLYESHYLNYVKDAKGNVLYDTVIYPERPGVTSDVSSYALPIGDVENNGATAMRVNIESDDGTYVDADYYLVHDPLQQRPRKFGAYQTDGRSTYIGRDATGKISQVFLQDTAEISDSNTGKILFKAEAPVSELGYTKESYRLAMASSAEVDLDTITIYLENAGEITEIILNGENVDFKKSGNYIYFGSEPIITDDKTDDVVTPPASSDPSGNHGTGGVLIPIIPSGGGSGGGGSSGGGGGSSGGSAVVVPVTPSEPAIPEAFLNELETHWGKEELTDALKNGILKGLNEETLGLFETTTRAQFVTLILRAMGIEAEKHENVFTDVPENEWYRDYVLTAYNKGLVNGVGEGSFLPDAEITREEMAKIITLAYAMVKNEEISVSDTENFADDLSISDWAKEYVYYARKCGLLKGDENNDFRPHDNVTRDEAAVSAVRLKNLIK